MKRPITARTRLLVILGNPVHHSLSPVFQNAAIAAAGLDAVYVALPCDDAERIAGLLAGIANAGGAGNVTVPHKAAAAAVVELATEAVVATGACNTFWFEDGLIRGDNTDVLGFLRSAESLLGGPPAGARVLLVGAGGAANAVAYGLLRAGAAEIVVTNRSPERAAELGRRHTDLAGNRLRTTPLDDLRGEKFDLVVNATSLGLRPDDPHPLPPPEEGPRFAAALDLVYKPERTAWVNALRERGVLAEDGLEMLLQQGAAAFERWFATDAPIAAMRAALPPR